MHDIFHLDFNNDQWIYFLALFTALVMIVLALNIVRSRIGRAFIAIRDSEIAAQAMGISVPRYKTMAFAISAFYGGVAGGVYTQVVGYVSPESFNFLLSINFLTTIVVGGLASILGSVLGAAGLVVVPELPGVVGFIPGAALPAELSWAFYGVALILVMISAPAQAWRRLRERGRGAQARAGLARTRRIGAGGSILRGPSGRQKMKVEWRYP
jgi:branched-chain amino acid transport system permease protein